MAKTVYRIDLGDATTETPAGCPIVCYVPGEGVRSVSPPRLKPGMLVACASLEEARTYGTFDDFCRAGGIAELRVIHSVKRK